MKINELVLRCYAQKTGQNAWHAVCIDLCLAAQGSSIEEVKQKLDAQIRDYVYDALVGEDRSHAVDLLTRRAPFTLVAKYYFAKCCGTVRRLRETTAAFCQALPVAPSGYDKTVTCGG